MRKRFMLLAITGFLAVAFGGVALAGSQDISGPTTVNVISANQVQVFDDLNASATIDQGDLLVLNSPLYAKGGGAAIGRFGLHVTVTSATEGEAMFTASLPDGQITAQGLYDLAEAEGGSAVFAVTGGTGLYNNARGQVTAVFVTANRTRLTYELIP